MKIYLDGIPAIETDSGHMPVNEYAAVEFYAGAAAVPVEYNATGSSCGVLLLWTRKG